MKLDEVKQGLSEAWESLADGWRRLKDSASSALTRFNSSEQKELPTKKEVDDDSYFPSIGWAMLAGNVFEDENKIVVRLEVPGLSKENLRIETVGDQLVIAGEKRFQREAGEGRYRSFQCAYGSFQRTFRLPAPVRSDQAKANYSNGVLSIELPKELLAKPKVIDVPIN